MNRGGQVFETPAASLLAEPRVAPLYDDPYEESPASHSIPSSVNGTSTPDLLRQRLSIGDDTSAVFDNRGPGDGASARRDLPPFAVISMPDIDDSTINSSTASQPVTFINSSIGNYDEPWDLSSKQRELEDRLRSVPNLGWSPVSPAASPAPAARSQSQSSDDSRPWADGYDRPWDLQPHRRDLRDDAGYDKPWDLKPHEKDVRASVAAVGDYDAPWDIKPRSVVERELIAAKSAKDAVTGRAGGLNNAARPVAASPAVSQGVAAARLAAPSPSSSSPSDTERPAPLPRDQKVKVITPKMSVPAKSTPSTPTPSGALSPPPAEKIDPRLPLNQQSWYHGSISRVDAENLLRVQREGSYLVRTSESNRQDYSLSVKSAKGFMHMKIATETSADAGSVRYILGQFSQPFSSIPQMIYHYTVNKLPVKGAEHMCLMYPVGNELL